MANDDEDDDSIMDSLDFSPTALRDTLQLLTEELANLTMDAEMTAEASMAAAVSAAELANKALKTAKHVASKAAALQQIMNQLMHASAPLSSEEETIVDPTRELYDLCTGEEAFDRIRQWLNHNKEDNTRLKVAITYQGEHNYTPLHIILKKLDIIQTFINYAPEAPQMMDRFGCLPIHEALWNEPSLKVVVFLIASYPESVKKGDFNGSIPLHYAIQYQASLEVVTFPIASYPESVEVADGDGDTPLHYTFRENAHLRQLPTLLNPTLKV